MPRVRWDRSANGEAVGGGDAARRLARLLELHRLVGSERASTARVLAWLAERAGCRVALFDRVGRVVRIAEGDGAPLPRLPAWEVFATKRPVTVPTAAGTWMLVPLGREHPVLAGFGGCPSLPEPMRFLRDAAPLVAISHGREEHAAEKTRLAESRFGLREGVVTLVLSGRITAAHRVADLLGDRLPEPARVFVVDTEPVHRDRIAAACAGGHTREVWVARCPHNPRQVLVIADATCAADVVSAELAALDAGCRVGASTPLPLRHATFGYHRVLAAALPAAHRRPRRWAVLPAERGLAHVVGPAGRAWARTFLAPLLDHVPTRTQDPTRDELKATARTWLAHGAEAPRRLYVHRNTLAARLGLVGELLGVDFRTLEGQALVALALDLDALPQEAPPTPDPGRPDAFDDPPARDRPGPLDVVLHSTVAREWAADVLRGAHTPPDAPGAVALRAWLASDAHANRAAAATGVSVSALRKRLARLVPTLGGDVVTHRTLRRDLWLALRITEGRTAGITAGRDLRQAPPPR
ncbi:PucR family transcriptional regulator [Embleya sp. MST-111070]|uniref:PucR family transcriptional regulator n=1 Tax=Embleya sp. MST-111070 TaxID=3398231 RepID=UPI003F73DE74